MAPFPAEMYLVLETSLNELQQRNLGNSTAHLPSLSAEKQKNLQILAVTCSSISLASATLAFYWFLKMRRSFRHHLIMLLIQSDMFKALWFLIYPIVVFTHGELESSSRFCQVNGFFVSLGIEASDFAILMIAIHSALYIFRPVAPAGEGGLYPYRRIAYVLWVLLPLLAASLAFIDGPDAYVPQGTYCYLPVRPFWFRLALSWIPRYAIFLVILTIYASIYFYVRYKFDNFDKKSPQNSSLSRSEERSPIRHTKADPLTPPLVYNGLATNFRNHSFSEHKPSRPSVSTLNSEHGPRTTATDIVIDVSTSFYIEPPITTPGGHNREASGGLSNSAWHSALPQDVEEGATFTPNTTDEQEAGDSTTARPFSTASTLISKTSSPFNPFFSNPFPHSNSPSPRTPRQPTGTINNPSRSEGTTTIITLNNLELVDTRGENVTISELVKTRDKIRKQLRFLFIYPLVYIAMWVVPFINHVLQYNDKLALNPPYGLTCATVIFVALQCAVDCWLFSTREQPWRHIPTNESGTFWGSFLLWRGAERRRSSTSFGASCAVSGPGKSRAEQIAGARLAYRRREWETEAARVGDAERRRIRGEAAGEMERNWWDVGEGFEGATMSPVVEEMDPLDLEGRTDNNRGRLEMGPKGESWRGVRRENG